MEEEAASVSIILSILLSTYLPLYLLSTFLPIYLQSIYLPKLAINWEIPQPLLRFDNLLERPHRTQANSGLTITSLL